MMTDSRTLSMEELRTFLDSGKALTFTGYSRAETYAWIERTLRTYNYLTQSKVEKGLLRRYTRKITGLSSS